MQLYKCIVLQNNVFMTYLSPIVPRLLTQRLGFSPGLVPAGLVVDKITLGQVFLPVLQLSPFNFVSNKDSPAEGQ
jgi:hypothetical protein